MIKKKTFVLLVLVQCLAALFYSANAQNIGFKIENNKLTYLPDALGNTMLDYSYCGYQMSANDIPFIPNKVFVQHKSGDMSAEIQAAINYVSGLKPDANGFRGAVLLDKGNFELNNSLRISQSGVVLRGSSVSETKLIKKGVDRAAIVYIEGKNDIKTLQSSPISTKYVAVNARSFALLSTAGFKVGDPIIIHQPSTKEWIADMACYEFGGGISALGWKPGDIDLFFHRKIIDIKGNEITIDAPLSVALDGQFAQSTVSKYAWNGRIENSGVEQLRLIAEYDKNNAKHENHAWTGISIDNAADGWVRNVRFEHLAGSAVVLLGNTARITVEDCISRLPVSEIGGGRRTAFLNYGQLNLFQRCIAYDAIHAFAVGHAAAGPNAFVQCEAYRALGYSGPIDSWATGLLYDIVNIEGNNLSFKNLGQYKNGAGWTTANSTFWQCTAAVIENFSPHAAAPNRAYGCWAQFDGNGLWAESNNHVQPRSLFYAQLEQRLGRDVSKRAAILPKNTNATSSPTAEVALELAREAYEPLYTLEKHIDNANVGHDAIDVSKLLNSSKLPMVKPIISNINTNIVSIKNGKLIAKNTYLGGAKSDVQWWSGKIKAQHTQKARMHLTRFVPGREGHGLTDCIDSVLQNMQANNVLAIDHNYGLWYDRRRDDHQRIKRADGDVWAPFYEQPFARSGQGMAWDGLSLYDLERPNEWYWMRLKTFANKAEASGRLLYHQHFFQHNILEAGAHWVDSPWRTANNINNTGFPEPVNFAGDKRIFVADMFYDTTHVVRRKLLRNYIRMGLDAFAHNSNVVHFISAEYTGPLHFVQFWLDVVAEWEAETGKNAKIALSTTKDVQDAILKDARRAAVVDIIDIQYWFYRNDGSAYAPEGGLNLAPRQHARLQKTGKPDFHSVYRAVSEYRKAYPTKAVMYHGSNYPEFAWAVFMAGGSCAALPTLSDEFLNAGACATKHSDFSAIYQRIECNNGSNIIFSHSESKITIDVKKGNYALVLIDTKSGKEQIISKKIRLTSSYVLVAKPGVYWLKALR